ncbi:nucleotidyltransferase family protein [Salinicola halimionae]|uniref:nucleotidyltransferase family protein n=1 Tax=Salinicola halimionae TaxID=1949081 RepID=UPI000DA15550|nr:nucleotidyltransferase family protein [Salinicola halimionae]
MTDAERLCGWIRADAWRMAALRKARSQGLPDWWLAAGFVRNLVWDRLHGYASSTPLNDIDLVYFEPANPHALIDREHEASLNHATHLPWSVKNQARMHHRHGHAAYTSIEEALSVWVECETAVGVTLDDDERLRLLAPLGIESLMAGRVTSNPYHGDREVFRRRVSAKGWRHRWPRLEIEDFPGGS